MENENSKKQSDNSESSNNNIENNIENLKTEKPEVLDEIKNKMQGIMLQEEHLFMSNQSPSSVFVKNLEKDERKMLIKNFEKSEDNAFKLEMKKLEVIENVSKAKIKSKGAGIKNVKYIIFFTVSILAVITGIIIFFAREFFSEWIAFIVGISGGGLGGFGLSKSGILNFNNLVPQNLQNNDDKK